MSDPGTTYRTREEIQQMKETRDPILKVEKYLFDFNFATEEELKVHTSKLHTHTHTQQFLLTFSLCLFFSNVTFFRTSFTHSSLTTANQKRM
jgi:hypothetical protein